MKDDLKILPVKDVQVAVVKKTNSENVDEWYVYLINNGNFFLENVLIATKGYGTIDGEEKKTSVLRHMIEEVVPKSAALIEPIQPDLFQLSNEFWVSYYLDRQIYDKKYVFVAGSIVEENLTSIPYMDEKGILHG